MKRKPKPKETPRPRSKHPFPGCPIPDHYEPIGDGNYRTPPCRPAY